MKGIKKTFMAGILASAAFNVHAEVSPFGYGFKDGIGVSSAIGYGNEVKIGAKEAESGFFDTLTFFGNLYGEYAVTDYIGFGLEAGYMKQGAALKGEKKTQEGDNSESTASSIGMDFHGIVLPFYLCLYPLGREEEEGILKVTLGPAFYLPFKTTYEAGDKKLVLDQNQEKQQRSYDVALTGGIGYEFSFGGSIEAKYSYGLLNRFKTEKNNPQTIFRKESAPAVEGLKKLHIQHATVSLGYNLASLF